MAQPWAAVIGGLRGPALPRHPGALAGDRHRGARPVPQGQRRPGRQRTRLRAARRRHRPDPDRRRLRRARRGGADRAAVAGFARGLEATPGRQLGRRRPPSPADSALIQATPSAAERVRRGHGAGRPPARRLRPGDRPGRVATRRRRRRNRPQPRRPRPDHRLDVEDRPLRPRPQLHRPDGDAALAAAAAEGGADEPALDRRRLRRPRRRLPVGLARRPARLRKPGRAGHDQRAADLRRRLRPLDGLRGLPDVADPRALHARTATTSARSPRASPPAPARSPRRR